MDESSLKSDQALLSASISASPRALLLLSDSALPLGSFAFSAGLESYLTHQRQRSPAPSTDSVATTASFRRFLALSITSVAGTTLPYILAAHRDPSSLLSLDNDLDASTLCAVARRASIAQGRALLSVWEQAFRSSSAPSDPSASALLELSTALKLSPRPQALSFPPYRPSSDFHSYPSPPSRLDVNFPANGHFAPVWAVVCRSMSLSLAQTAYIFIFNHAKTVISAAVRASVIGPYQAQAILASDWLEGRIYEGMRIEWETAVTDAGQRVPVLDLWVGRHELLYSRIFSS